MKLLLFLSISLSVPLAASAAETWTFSSKYDRFSLNKRGNDFFFNGEKVKGNWARDLLPVLTNEMNIQCEGLPKKADLRLTWTKNNQTVKRNFYLKEKVASDGENCLELTGQGVYFAPYHRAWFVGDEKLSLNLYKDFEIGSEIETWVKFKKENGRLMTEADFAVNWETLEKLQNLFADFPVDGRAHPEIFQDPERNLTAKNIIIKTGGRTFSFRQVKGGTWLMKMPKVPWLVLSSHFGIFSGMDKGSWVSQYSDQLILMKNTEAPVKERVSAVRALRPKGSKDVFNAYHDLLLDPEQNEEVKSAAVNALRFYPSDKNMAILAMALEKTESPELVFEIIKVLKLRNPKGPQVDIKDDWADIEEQIEVWRKWAKPFEKAVNK